MGAVWHAEHARLPGKRVAVKVLHAEVAADDESLARFRREAEIASRLGHPNIVDVHDFNLLPDGTPYLILELLEGEDLSQRLARGPMPLDEVSSVVRQVGSALQAAHRENIVHRDLKPQNVFLVPTEAGGVVHEQAKVLDFGISKIRGSQTVKTNAATMLGTPQYMAPEQATGNHDAVDARTDVFALGAMVYEMLAGRPAFLGQTIPEVVFKVVYEEPTPLAELVDVPPGVADAIHKALSKKQEERFADVSSFVEALTGSRLHTLQKGAVIAGGDAVSGGAPTGALSGSAAGTDALAATIDSGKAEVDPSLGLASTVDSSKAPALAATVDSGKAELEAGLASTVDSSKAGLQLPPTSVAEEAPAPAERKGRGLWLALGALAIAGAAVAVTVSVIGGGSGEQPTAAAAMPADAGSEMAAPAIPPAASDNAPDAAAVAPEPTPKKDEPTPKKDEPTPKKDDDDSDGAQIPAKIVQQLVRAEGQLRAGNADRALLTARRTLAIKETGAAYSVMARAYCQKRDLGMAQAMMRNIKGQRMQRKVRAYCRKQGTDL